MILPITFEKVTYNVAGSSKYKGDLIVTPEVIYYFPNTDVANKRFFVIAIILFILLSPLLAVASAYLLYIFIGLFIVLLVAAGFLTPALILPMVTSVIKNLLKYNKELRPEKLHKELREKPFDPNDDEQLSDTVDLSSLSVLYPIILYPTLWYSLILDTAFLVLMENKSLSPHSIPIPTRFSKGNICDISLSVKGLLIITTEFDMQNKFHLGTSRKDFLEKGLKEGGLIS